MVSDAVSMASGAVSALVQYVIRLVDEEIDLLGSVRDDVESLQGHLRLINIFLEKSEGKQSDEIEEEVVQQIRTLVYKIEDVIDRHILSVAQFRKRNVVVQTFSIDYPIWLHGVGKKIQGFEKKIKKVLERRREYGNKSAKASVGPAAPNEALRRRRRDVEKHDVVGFSKDSATLVKQLTEGNPKREVISITGMGGLGKTTLALKIYNSDSVKNHFDCCSWVCVSPDFRVLTELLSEILTSHMPISDRDKLAKKIKRMSNDELRNEYLREQLFEYLKGKRYLVVMDDVWSTDVWDQVKSAFPEDVKGSRILITSRNNRVAPSFAGHTPYNLRFLKEDESWELLRKKVFRSEACSSELEVLGRKMVKGCCGLPLFIVLLGSLLAEKEKTYQKWSQLDDYVNGNLNTENTKICKDILALSYIHLRRKLKLCFLYLGVYPKDYDIPVWQLIQLWIAEGFIPRTEGKKIEDIAEFEYLDELIDQNLIQVVSRRTDGRKKTCRISGLLRDICISECKNEMFLEVSDDSLTNNCRRLSFQGSTLKCISSKCARSLSFFGQNNFYLDTDHWKWILKHLKLVRVLIFRQVNLCSIPTKIEKLILLRYLRIESPELTCIPPSICNLTNLETLDMRGTPLSQLPNGIWKLPHLRNLHMFGAVNLPDNLNSDEALWKLEVLSTVSLKPQNVGFILEAELLRKLGIWFESDEVGECRTAEVLASLHNHKLANLQTLKIINCLEGYRLPISFPSTITKITLREVQLKSRQDMKVLGELPELQILKLQKCSLSNTLHFFIGSFLKLQVLKLEKLTIEKWRQRRAAMPNLKHLVIKRCTELTMLRLKLRKLTALPNVVHVEVLWISSQSESMLQKLKEIFGFELVIENLEKEKKKLVIEKLQ